MANAYFAGTTTVGRALAVVKEKILRSSDWTHLQLAAGTAATTLSAAAAIGATSISTAATIPSGSYVVIGNGAATPEVRLTTAVSGAGPFTVSFAEALVAAYSSGAAVGVGTYVKATTTRVAQMVLDLADAAITTNRLQIGVYRTHDGTTGVDKVIRYITFNNATPAASTGLYVWVSSGKEHVYIALEGPRASETGAMNSTHGSVRQSLGMSDIVPYIVGDTVPAVVMVGHSNQNVDSRMDFCWVSRNYDNTVAWGQAQLLTLSTPTPVASGGGSFNNWLKRIARDGNYYMGPYVVCDPTDGLRGRAAKFFWNGITKVVSGSGEQISVTGENVTYNAEGFVTVSPSRAGSGVIVYTAFGVSLDSGPASVIDFNHHVIAVPNGL